MIILLSLQCRETLKQLAPIGFRYIKIFFPYPEQRDADDFFLGISVYNCFIIIKRWKLNTSAGIITAEFVMLADINKKGVAICLYEDV